ncbi:hypothetical protein L226DRAFT_386838 [Lentinus tigrinus ALCF2SS1-7]|uniref:EthD domain-containing protein n=1 Tax=Lentinus tigrinus ALCF2SS1-6 TaxID=1328759 RepID=A0A5C2S9I9_9APHY|nr:hypothetical protein L227DRAFT_575105 [Lentinus tigrinus ALCF2SS1-6]RPD75735.1 hypothetical protein L226DRAFT_386838 [Lentinus tigrinus ALCF2SS1-7]
MPEGILLVFSDPGSAVSEAEYNDWYDNEHVPLRIPIPAFQSWSRWVAVDGEKPAYFALYDLTDLDAINQPPYSILPQTRSDREKDIISRIGVLDRRGYEKVDVPVPPRKGAAYDVRSPGPYISAVLMDVPPEFEEDLNKWYNEEHTELLSKAPQWVRTTRYVYRDGGVSGNDESLKPKKVPKFLALHEWTDPSIVEAEEFKAALATPWTKKVTEYATVFDKRFFKLHKTWERQ